MSPRRRVVLRGVRATRPEDAPGVNVVPVSRDLSRDSGGAFDDASDDVDENPLSR
ncbi:MAG: hypothetical protein KGJ47_09975 [Acidobacteriota bacterium]|nr:hypothetical protein [Acidobacteriota bacterium]MDE3094094.1 hypothetical protein [Acidobacteriota bacterium]